MSRTFTRTITTPAAARLVRPGSRPVISFITDFGTRDPSAGMMRAVVLGICPDASIVDLSHEVEKYRIRDGALLMWSAAPYLPVRSDVAVVDPGVGTERRAVAMGDGPRRPPRGPRQRHPAARGRPPRRDRARTSSWRARNTGCRSSAPRSTAGTSSRPQRRTWPWACPSSSLVRRSIRARCASSTGPSPRSIQASCARRSSISTASATPSSRRSAATCSAPSGHRSWVSRCSCGSSTRTG